MDQFTTKSKSNCSYLPFPPLASLTVTFIQQQHRKKSKSLRMLFIAAKTICGKHCRGNKRSKCDKIIVALM